MKYSSTLNYSGNQILRSSISSEWDIVWRSMHCKNSQVFKSCPHQVVCKGWGDGGAHRKLLQCHDKLWACTHNAFLSVQLCNIGRQSASFPFPQQWLLQLQFSQQFISKIGRMHEYTNTATIDAALQTTQPYIGEWPSCVYNVQYIHYYAAL